MRKLFLVAVACAVTLPSVVAGTPAASLPKHSRAKAAVTRPGAALPRMPGAFVPLARRLTGSAVITADVFGPGSVASVGGAARLVVRDADGSVAYNKRGQTDAAGRVSFSGVPAASASGEIAYSTRHRRGLHLRRHRPRLE